MAAAAFNPHPALTPVVVAQLPHHDGVGTRTGAVLPLHVRRVLRQHDGILKRRAAEDYG